LSTSINTSLPAPVSSTARISYFLLLSVMEVGKLVSGIGE